LFQCKCLFPLENAVPFIVHIKFFSKRIISQEALSVKSVSAYSKLEQEGIVQRFEYTFELAWKTMKDRLFYEGYDEKTPRSVIRRAFEVDFISEAETEVWLDALDARKLLSHTYNETTALTVLDHIEKRYSHILTRLYERLKPEADFE